MSVAYQTSTGNGVQASTTIALTKPTGTVTGDLLLTGSACWDAGVSIGTLSPWALVKDGIHSATRHQQVWSLIAGGSEPASYTWTVNSGGSTRISGLCARFSGAHQTTPVPAADVSASYGTADWQTTLVAPNITNVAAGDASVICVSQHAVSNPTIGGNWTRVAMQYDAATNVVEAMFVNTTDTGTVTGPTISTGGSNQIAISFRIAAAGGGGGGSFKSSFAANANSIIQGA